MAFSSGVFSLVAGNPVVTGTTVSSTWANNTLTDIATGLSTCILKDGTQTTTVLVPFAQGINSTLATDSTSTTTGSIITAGGIGIAKALNVGTTITGASIQAAGAEQLRFWTYTHTVTAGEKAANLASITVTAVTQAKVRSLSAGYFAGGSVWDSTGNGAQFNTYLRLTSTTNVDIGLGASAATNDVISITIIEAV